MKVIVRGTPPSEKRYRCSCDACKSVIEYAQNEILKQSYSQRDGSTNYLGPCPVCGIQLNDYAPREYIEHDGCGPG